MKKETNLTLGISESEKVNALWTNCNIHCMI